MGLLLAYLLFAITTAITAVITSLIPAISQRESKGFKVEKKGLMYFSFFLVALVSAPLVFFSFATPSLSNIFQIHVYEGLFGKIKNFSVE